MSGNGAILTNIEILASLTI